MMQIGYFFILFYIFFFYIAPAWRKGIHSVLSIHLATWRMEVFSFQSSPFSYFLTHLSLFLLSVHCRCRRRMNPVWTLGSTSVDEMTWGVIHGPVAVGQLSIIQSLLQFQLNTDAILQRIYRILTDYIFLPSKLTIMMGKAVLFDCH